VRHERYDVRIATRTTELAQREARMVAAMLEARGLTTHLVPIKTEGDKRINEPLAGVETRGLFTRELEAKLLSRKVDCCVYALKDLPTDATEGLAIAAMLERDDPRDALIVNDSLGVTSLDELPRGSRVGASSPRRRALLLARRPDVEAVELRGTIPARVRKVDNGQVHATILGVAALHHLDIYQRIDEVLDPPEWLPAPGQAVIAVQIRADDDELRETLAPLNHEPTSIAARAERSCLEALHGGNNVPLGALVMGAGEDLVLHAFIGDPRGTHLVRSEATVDPGNPEGAGRRVAYDILSRGGLYILERLRGEHKPMERGAP
jgi:hydroxymethylbilane synthase